MKKFLASLVLCVCVTANADECTRVAKLYQLIAIARDNHAPLAEVKETINASTESRWRKEFANEAANQVYTLPGLLRLGPDAIAVEAWETCVMAH